MSMTTNDGASVRKGENAGYKKRRETAECFLVKQEGHDGPESLT